MLDQFNDWLKVRVSPERAVVILDAIELLSMLSDHRVEDLAINAMSLSERLNDEDVVSGLAVDLRDYSLAIPLEYGVTIAEERFEFADQAKVNKILLALTQVDAWEDVTRILDLTQQDESNEEIFASICEEITGVDPEDVLSLLENVTSDLIEKIVLLCKNKLELSEDVSLLPLWQLDLLKLNASFNLGGNGIGHYLREEGTMGLTFTQYVDMFVNSFFTDRDLIFQAKNWILMSMASGTTEKELIYTQCVAMFDEIYANLELQSKLAKIIKSVIDQELP